MNKQLYFNSYTNSLNYCFNNTKIIKLIKMITSIIKSRLLKNLVYIKMKLE
jgi:hypothetical protein